MPQTDILSAIASDRRRAKALAAVVEGQADAPPFAALCQEPDEVVYSSVKIIYG